MVHIMPPWARSAHRHHISDHRLDFRMPLLVECAIRVARAGQVGRDADYADRGMRIRCDHFTLRSASAHRAGPDEPDARHLKESETVTSTNDRQPTPEGLDMTGTRRIPLNIFGMGFGLAGLATAWRIAVDQHLAPHEVSDVLIGLAAVVWLVSVLLYLRYVLTTRGGPHLRPARHDRRTVRLARPDHSHPAGRRRHRSLLPIGRPR